MMLILPVMLPLMLLLLGKTRLILQNHKASSSFFLAAGIYCGHVTLFLSFFWFFFFFLFFLI